MLDAFRCPGVAASILDWKPFHRGILTIGTECGAEAMPTSRSGFFNTPFRAGDCLRRPAHGARFPPVRRSLRKFPRAIGIEVMPPAWSGHFFGRSSGSLTSWPGCSSSVIWSMPWRPLGKSHLPSRRRPRFSFKRGEMMILMRLRKIFSIGCWNWNGGHFPGGIRPGRGIGCWLLRGTM